MAKKKVPSKRLEEETLSLSDRFYIENHGELSVEKIADDLGKPVELVTDYCKQWVQKNSSMKSRTKKAMHRPAKGTLAMTEAASMMSDEAHKQYVSLEAINRAVVEGDYELANELKKRYEDQQRANKDIIKNKYRDMIHYIEGPDEVN